MSIVLGQRALSHTCASSISCFLLLPQISITKTSGALNIKCVFRIKPTCRTSFHQSFLLALLFELTNHTALHISSYSSSVLNQENQLNSLYSHCSYTATWANLGVWTHFLHIYFLLGLFYSLWYSVIVHTQHCCALFLLGLPSAIFTTFSISIYQLEDVWVVFISKLLWVECQFKWMGKYTWSRMLNPLSMSEEVL